MNEGDGTCNAELMQSDVAVIDQTVQRDESEALSSLDGRKRGMFGSSALEA